jgi:hypothetical protein
MGKKHKDKVCRYQPHALVIDRIDRIDRAPYRYMTYHVLVVAAVSCRG